MYPFRTVQGARFWCRADFAAGSVLNLHFYDESRKLIPFHVSLRRDEELVVVNRRDENGWRREIPFPTKFEHRLVPVEILFSSGRVALSVDGALIGRFDALPRPDLRGRKFLRRGFPRLNAIAFVGFEGWPDHDSFELDMFGARPPVPPGLHVSDALEVTLRGFQAGDDLSGRVHIEGFDETLSAHLRPLPRGGRGRLTERMLSGVLPGRIWDCGAEALRITLSDAKGAPLGETRLERAGLAERVARLAAAGALVSDDRAALQAIEHVRHAGVLAALDAGALQALLAAAERFGLAGYLQAGSLGEADVRALGVGTAAALPDADDDSRAIAAAERFGAAMRADPSRDPLALLRDEAQSLASVASRQVFLLRLIEWFGLAGRIGDLLETWRALEVPMPPEPSEDDVFARGQQLPLAYAGGQFKEVWQSLGDLAKATLDWLPAEAIGWVMARAATGAPGLDGRLPRDLERTNMVGVALDLLVGQAPNYWGRVPSLPMIDGMVAILRHADTLPANLAERAQMVAGSVYALVPAFWRAVAEEQARSGWHLPARLAAMQARFAALRAGIEVAEGDAAEQDCAGLARHLAPFHQLQTADHARYARDLLGPLGVAVTDATDPLAPLFAGLNPEEAALRALASPGAELPEVEAFLETARKGLAAAYGPRVPRSPFETLIRRLVTDATAILAVPDAAGSQARIAEFAADLAPVASLTGRYMGLALPLMLLRGLLAQGRADEGAVLVRALRAMINTLDVDDSSLTGLHMAAAPRLALDALARDHPAVPMVAEMAARLGPLLRPAARGPKEDRAADLAATVSPMQDTLLCLYTCQPYLQTRVKAIRETWLPLLAQSGVPVLIFVGGGDGRREGDIVHLDAPDDYEGLPQKTLALVRWVSEHTSFAHLVKIDDDCFVDPEAWFGDLAHRAVDYYGRHLARKRGQVDRVWHQAKSRSARGRLELDKSPEPSSYADGGSGYALSRHGMDALLEAADSPEGRALIAVSFLEDKLIGDLLSLRGIKADATDYRISVLRRTMPGGPLVAQWENSFLPFKGSGIRLAHLDGDEKMVETLAGLARPRPSQFKIWPSFQPARLGWESNTLDLISTRDKLEAVNAAEIAVVTCLRNEMFMLPRFLEHYRALGVRGFLIADNGSDDGSFEYLAGQPDVALFAVDTAYSVSRYGVAWQQALISNLRPGRWSLMADADELLVWNTDLSGDLPTLVATEAFTGADAARIFMLDMYPEGPLSEADFTRAGPFEQAGFVDCEPFLTTSASRGPYSDSPIWTSALRHRLIPGSRAELFVAQKYALLKYRPWMRLSAGLHFVSDVTLARRELLFAHFKYNAQFRAKAQAEVARRQHFNNAEEYRKYLALVSEGRDVIFAPEVSVRWDQAGFVRRVCAGEGLSE